MKRAIMMHETDNVATAFDDILVNEDVEIIDFDKKVISVVKSVNSINRGHKISLVDIEKDSFVIKYGHLLSKASVSIPKGSFVHTHNTESNRGRGDLNWT